MINTQLCGNLCALLFSAVQSRWSGDQATAVADQAAALKYSTFNAQFSFSSLTIRHLVSGIPHPKAAGRETKRRQHKPRSRKSGAT